VVWQPAELGDSAADLHWGVAVLSFARGGGGPQGALSIGKSKAKVYVEGEAGKITFDDVAGVEEAKAELVEIVDFLKTPKRFTDLGAKIPKGCCWSALPGPAKPCWPRPSRGGGGALLQHFRL
jgi:cell division protease FtsH